MKKAIKIVAMIMMLVALVACSNGTTTNEENANSSKSTKTVNPDRGDYGLLTGIVVDSYTAAPVEGVTVSIDGTNYKFVTKADGTYYFDNLIVGDYTIIYSKDGYRAQKSETVKNSLYF